MEYNRDTEVYMAFLSEEYIIANVDNLDLCEVMVNQPLSEETIKCIMHRFGYKEWFYLKLTQDTPSIVNPWMDGIPEQSPP